MGRPAYETAVLADTPFVWWECLEGGGGLWKDTSGGGLTGIMTVDTGDSPYRCSGGGPGAYGREFQGGGTYSVNLPGGQPTDNLALEVWVLVFTGAAVQQAVTIGNSALNGYSIMLDATGNHPFQGLCGGVAFLAPSAGTVTRNVWHHIVIERAAGTWKYYFDGALDTANAGIAAPAVPTSRIIGGDTTLNFIVSNAAFYQHTLGAVRAKAHYDAMVLAEAWAPQQEDGGHG